MESSDLLLRIYDGQLAQLTYRRNRENEIFNWSSAIFLGFIGAALLFTRDKPAVLLQNTIGSLLASVVMALVCAFSVAWQLKQREFLAETQQTIVRIEKALGLFDQQHFQLPEEWAEWGTKNTTLRERLMKPSKVAATVILGILAISAALISGVL